MSFITELETAFEQRRNTNNAVPMEKYMKNHFSFFGLKTEENLSNQLKNVKIEDTKQIIH